MTTISAKPEIFRGLVEPTDAERELERLSVETGHARSTGSTVRRADCGVRVPAPSWSWSDDPPGGSWKKKSLFGGTLARLPRYTPLVGESVEFPRNRDRLVMLCEPTLSTC